MSFERLRRIEKPTFKKGSAKNLEEFYEILIKNQFKHSDIIKKIHNSILQYIETPNPTFFLRLYGSHKKENYDKQRRGFLSKYKSGINISYCDNTFSLIFAGMKLSGISFTVNDLSNLLTEKKLITGFAQVSKEKELAYYTPKGAIRYDVNTKGWYQAHIKPTGKDLGFVKSLKTMFPNPPREEFNSITKFRLSKETLNNNQIKVLKAHFVRLIHPLNSFLVPKRKHIVYNGINIGEEPGLIMLVRNKLLKQFPKEMKELDLISLESQFSHSLREIKDIYWETTEIKKTDQEKKILLRSKKNILSIHSDFIVVKRTRFYVDENIFNVLKKNPKKSFKLIISPIKGKHPKGYYILNNKQAVDFINSKRIAYNWIKNGNFHQDGIPKQLTSCFHYL